MRPFAKGLVCGFVAHFAIVPVIDRGYGQESREIRVVSIKPGLDNGFLTVSALIQGVFSPRIVSTIQSGLPSMVEIEVQVLTGKKSKVRRRILRAISYNIWEERYRIESEDSVMNLSDFNQVKQIASRLDRVRLVRQRLLDRGAQHSIRIRVGVTPISVRQGQKVVDWLREPDQTEEDVASEERSSSFRFDLSRLISFFVGGNKSRPNRSRWYSSAKFRLSDLTGTATP